MQWSHLRPKLIADTIAATIVGVIVSILGNISLVLSVIVLLVSWPVSDWIIEMIASKNPSYKGGMKRKKYWIPMATISIWFICAFIVYWLGHLSFYLSLACSVLGVSVGGAILGVIAQFEDNCK
jgi:hypothetical protein